VGGRRGLLFGRLYQLTYCKDYNQSKQIKIERKFYSVAESVLVRQTCHRPTIYGYLIDPEPLKLSQTWKNGRKGDNMVAKRLNRFIILEDLIENPWIIKSCVAVGGIFDHMPILLKIDKKEAKSSSLLKFNQA
jgi:hypothetical protein